MYTYTGQSMSAIKQADTLTYTNSRQRNCTQNTAGLLSMIEDQQTCGGKGEDEVVCGTNRKSEH